MGGVDEPGPFIQTLSGRRVNPLDASPEDIDAADIARALANTCRFGVLPSNPSPHPTQRANA